MGSTISRRQLDDMVEVHEETAISNASMSQLSDELLNAPVQLRPEIASMNIVILYFKLAAASSEFVAGFMDPEYRPIRSQGYRTGANVEPSLATELTYTGPGNSKASLMSACLFFVVGCLVMGFRLAENGDALEVMQGGGIVILSSLLLMFYFHHAHSFYSRAARCRTVADILQQLRELQFRVGPRSRADGQGGRLWYWIHDRNDRWLELAGFLTVPQTVRPRLVLVQREVSNFVPGIPGAMVRKVTPGGNAHRAGINAGDMIQRVNGTIVNGTEHLRQILQLLPAGDEVEMSLCRDRGQLHVRVALPFGLHLHNVNRGPIGYDGPDAVDSPAHVAAVVHDGPPPAVEEAAAVAMANAVPEYHVELQNVDLQRSPSARSVVSDVAVNDSEDRHLID